MHSCCREDQCKLYKAASCGHLSQNSKQQQQAATSPQSCRHTAPTWSYHSARALQADRHAEATQGVVSLLLSAAVLSAAGSHAHLGVQPPGAGLMLSRSSCSTDASMRREHAIEEVAPAPCSVVIGGVRFRNKKIP